MSTLQARLRAMQNKAAADAADRLDELEAALEQAARICDEFQRQHGDSDNHGKVMALRIRTLAKGITP